jgi:cell division cycle 14
MKHHAKSLVPPEQLCQRIVQEFSSGSSSRSIQIFIAQNGGQPSGRFVAFQNDAAIEYHPYCDDFGPMNISTTINFIKQLEKEILACTQISCDQLVYSVQDGRRALTNAAMLLGCYLILKKNMNPDEVASCFARIKKELIEDFRDATNLPPDFGLTLRDCWRGLFRGKKCGWIARPSQPGSSLWGALDMDQYDQYDDPLNADLHEIVPEKLIAFRGPEDLGGAVYRDDLQRWTRKFAPAHFVGILRNLGVTDVVRLNEAEYDAGAFERAGMAHHDLVFDDCTEPPVAIVAAFLAVVDAARGAVAIHCRAGLGRTGTLIAVYMMRSHGFAAREAMGWLRLLRPGSVIGEQQRFLCTVERIRDERAAARRRAALSVSAPDVMSLAADSDHDRRRAAAARLDPAAAAAPRRVSSDAAAAQVAAAQVAAALDRQSAARIRAGRAAAAGLAAGASGP